MAKCVWVVVFATLAIALTTVRADDYKIGILLPFKSNPGLSQTTYNGFKLAYEEYKDEFDDELEYEQKDSNCDAAQATRGVKELVAEGALAIMGDLCSGSTTAAYPTAAAAKVAMVSPAATSPSLSTIGDYFFRTVATDAVQGAYAVNLFVRLKYTKVTIIYSDDAYGKGLYDAIRTNMRGKGTLYAYSYRDGLRNYNAVAAQMAATVTRDRPQAIYYVMSGVGILSAQPILSALKRAAPRTPLFASESMVDSTLLTRLGSVAEGLTITSPSLGTRDFQTKYQAAYKVAPTLYAAQAYDAGKAIFMAIKAVKEKGAVTADAVAKALPAVRFSSAQGGNMAWDRNGDVSGGYSHVVWRRGTLVPM